jgi:NhaP-type Na+/H+ or K+/H+ antiporter
LVLAGILLAFFSFFSAAPFTKELVFYIFLPPLVFEAALQIPWKELRRELPVILMLATVGICLSWGVTALGMRYLAGWEWISALFCGALIAAYGSFILAERFHFSGVLASLTAGVVVGNVGPLGSISPRGEETVAAYREWLGFVANSLVFMDMGLHLSWQCFAGSLMPVAVAILVVIAGRALVVYPCCALFHKSALQVQSRHQHVLFWGGLRGALALALALGLPPDVPHRDASISVTFVVVSFSIFVQGLTMTPLLRRLGEMPP